MEIENKKARPTYLKKNGGRRADTKCPRQALKTLDSNTSNVQQTIQPRLVGNEKARIVQDECFTPKRSLCRSPPSTKRPDQVGSITPVFRIRSRPDDVGATVAALHFQTPPHTQNSSDKVAATVPLNIEKDLLNAVPPQSKRELPRTPVCSKKENRVIPIHDDPSHQRDSSIIKQSKGKECEKSQSCDVGGGQNPLDNSSQHLPLPHDTSDVSQSVCVSEQQSHTVASEPAKLGTQNIEIPAIEVKTADIQKDICHLAPAPFLNPTAPPSLDCDENDVSFLRKIKYVRQYRHLETQMSQLDKGIKDATAQKELLECEAQKVKQDLVDMRAKYYETVASIQALISNPVGIGTSAAQPTTEPAAITGAHLKKLRQVQQAVAMSSDKIDKELKLKVAEMEVMKEKLCVQIKEEKQRVEGMAKKDHTALQCSQPEILEWQNKLKELQNHHSEMEEKLNASKTLLAMQQHMDKQKFLEKRRAENRLRLIIRRCEMCVQRHKQLKEMKTVP